jgi:hypothetical protein
MRLNRAKLSPSMTVLPACVDVIDAASQLVSRTIIFNPRANHHIPRWMHRAAHYRRRLDLHSGKTTAGHQSRNAYTIARR